MTKTEKEMMANLHDSEGIEKDEENFRNEKEEYIVDRDSDQNLSEWVRITTNYDDFFEHETISNIEYQEAMEEDNMKTKLIDNDDIENFETTTKEKEIEGKTNINLNPSLEDRWCDCCGRHINELTPFGKAGDPLVGNFDGALLVKKWRRTFPYNEQAEKAFKHVEKIMEEEGHAGEDPEGWMIKIYGKEKGQQYLNAVYAYGCIGSSRECRDCAILDEDEYFERLFKHI